MTTAQHDHRTPFQIRQATIQGRVHNAERHAGVTAYARPNGDVVTIADLGPDCHHDGQWAYRATLLTYSGEGENGLSATFHCPARPTPRGLRQRAGRVLADT